jgi:hypothetical protein
VRWRSAAAAAGIVAAVGLNAHKAAADEVEAPPADPPATTTTTATTAPPEEPSQPEQPDIISEEQRAQLAEAQAAADSAPVGEGPVRSRPSMIAKPLPADIPQLPESPAPPPEITDASPAPVLIHELVAPVRAKYRVLATNWPEGGPAEPQPTPLEAAPADDASGKQPAPSPAQANNATLTTTPATPKATPPPAVEPATSTDAWYPAWVAAETDQRIAEKWRTAPVRGPPPSTATALGNDSRNTTTQVVVVRDQFGHNSVAVSSQTATVHNVGTATADAHGGGDATATGNTSDTTILQVTVINVRGTGSATVEQSASVDNLGTASATTAGAADATAVGNNSSTSVTQIAVVYVEGAGDAHVTQSTDVDNVGVATAEATDRDATAVGNTSDTDVTQIAVVHVGDDDVNVNQTQNTSNIGVATATGGTASGNTATNTTTQVAKV